MSAYVVVRSRKATLFLLMLMIAGYEKWQHSDHSANGPANTYPVTVLK